MKLYFTPRSHFSRKVRILLHAWKLEVELIDVGNVGATSSHAFGPNPLMKVPTLLDGGPSIFDSDHIAQYLYDLVERRHPRLQEIVARMSSLPYVAASQPR